MSLSNKLKLKYKKINISRCIINIFIIYVIIINILNGIYVYGKSLHVEDFIEKNFISNEIKEYLNEKVPKSAELINTKVYIDYLEINQNGIININDKIDTQVYPFKYYEDGKNKIFTILSLDFPKNMLISKKDIVKVNTNLYFEDVNTILLVKNNKDQQWEKINIVSNTSLDNIYIYFDQIIDNKFDDFKIIMSFTSIENEHIKNDNLYYNINYLNNTIYYYINLINLIVVILIIIIFIRILLKIIKYIKNQCK